MAKYEIMVTVDEYIQYVVEADSVDEARVRGLHDFVEGVMHRIVPAVVVKEVDGDTPLGDVD
jgi:hypothetical protein